MKRNADAKAESTVSFWGIHAGKAGDADALFLKRNRIALGWPEVGDLSRVAPDREAFKAALAKAFPTKRETQVRVSAGQLFRFVHEMRVGDYIAYPSKQSRQVYLGRIQGEYRHEPESNQTYPHQRTVDWLQHHPRTKFSQGALYEIGSALSFFQIRTFTDEFLTALEGKAAPVVAVGEDETVGVVAGEIEEVTHDFVLKKLAQELKGHPLAHFVGHLLEVMGYRCRVSPEGPDGGVDILASKDELGFEPPILKVQVKSTEGSVGEPVVSALYGKVAANEFALIVTLGTYTPQARNFERSKSNLRLIDSEELVRLVLQHYERFESKYKGLLPLRRVYVPETVQEDPQS